jgi:hypothetical protein
LTGNSNSRRQGVLIVADHKEIVDRLSDNIRCEIEGRLRELLNASSDGHPLLLERYDPRGVLKETRVLQIASDWAVFFGAPSAVTLVALFQVGGWTYSAGYVYFSLLAVTLAYFLTRFGRPTPTKPCSEADSIRKS